MAAPAFDPICAEAAVLNLRIVTVARHCGQMFRPFLN
jgi:hypothetical protein